MPKAYAKAGPDVCELLGSVVDKWHPDLVECGARIAVLMVTPPTDANGIETGPALKLAGRSLDGRQHNDLPWHHA